MAKKKKEKRDEKPVISYLSIDDHEKFKITCVKNKISAKDIIEKLILEWIKNNG